MPYAADPLEGTLSYDPAAIFQGLSGSRGPLRFLPSAKIERLMSFLSTTDNVFELFCHAADGKTIREYAQQRGLDYLTLSVIFESDTPVLKAMRDAACKARSREDRDIARKALREAQERNYISEGRKRFVQANLDVAKLETPGEFANGAQVKVDANLSVSFGAALVEVQRERQHGRTIEHDPAPTPDI